MAILITSPSRQVLAPVMVEFAATPLATMPETAAASRSPIADADEVRTNAPPVIAVPAIDAVAVASAVASTAPSMVPISLTVPLNGARITTALPVEQSNAAPV